MLKIILQSTLAMFAIVVAASGYPAASHAQGGPDIMFDSPLTYLGTNRTACSVAIDPHSPTTSAVFREFTDVGNGYRFRFTTVAPGHVNLYQTGQIPSLSVPFPFEVSFDGRNVAYLDTTYATINSALRFSQDFGATFTAIPLPTFAPYNGGGARFIVNYSAINSMVFGPDGNLYVFYITTLNPLPAQVWNKFRLELLVVQPNGSTSHQSISTLSGNIGPSVGLADYLDVVATDSEIIAFVNPGPTYQATSTSTPYHSVPAAFVIDVATQTSQWISYGGNLGGANMSLFTNYPVRGESMLATDGENLFTIHGQLPFSNLPNFRIREFVKNSSSFAGFFINTAAPGEQPYMNLESPALQFGTEMKDLNIGNGVIHQISAKWPVATLRDHSVDVFYDTGAQLQSGVSLDVQRTRILDPNTGLKSATPTILNDFPSQLLAQMGIAHSIVDFTPDPVYFSFEHRITANSVGDNVATTYCQDAFFLPNGPYFSFHTTDIS